jgi:hypothetical protein
MIAVSGDLVHVVRHNILKIELMVPVHSWVVVAAETMHLTIVQAQVDHVRLVREVLPGQPLTLVLAGRDAVLVPVTREGQGQGQGQGPRQRQGQGQGESEGVRVRVRVSVSSDKWRC